jgi:hypothetical protein
VLTGSSGSEGCVGVGLGLSRVFVLKSLPSSRNCVGVCVVCWSVLSGGWRFCCWSWEVSRSGAGQCGEAWFVLLGKEVGLRVCCRLTSCLMLSSAASLSCCRLLLLGVCCFVVLLGMW